MLRGGGPWPGVELHEKGSILGGSKARRSSSADPDQALEALLGEGGDPDASGMSQFAEGVRLGVTTRLPRTPAVYPRKTRWRLESQACKDLEPRGNDSVWRDNYLTARVHSDDVEKQVEEHVERGLALKCSSTEAEAFVSREFCDDPNVQRDRLETSSLVT